MQLLIQCYAHLLAQGGTHDCASPEITQAVSALPAPILHKHKCIYLPLGDGLYHATKTPKKITRNHL